jgi:hypothetical protein
VPGAGIWFGQLTAGVSFSGDLFAVADLGF